LKSLFYNSHILNLISCDKVFHQHFVFNKNDRSCCCFMCKMFYFRKLMLIMMDGFFQRISEKKWSNKRAILRKLYFY
jgi:hypothetical protein